jgi:hypothetical protein
MTTDDVFRAYHDKIPVYSIKSQKWGYLVQVSAHGMGFFSNNINGVGKSHNARELSFVEKAAK